MSIIVKDFKEKLEVKGKQDIYTRKTKKLILTYKDENSNVHVPLAYAIEKGYKVDEKDHGKIEGKVVGNFRNEEQKEAFIAAHKALKKDGYFFMALRCAFGKTFEGCILSVALGLKTLVITHRVLLSDQWMESIKQFTTLKGFHITSNLEDGHDIYVCGEKLIKKLPEKFLKSIGFLVVDETREFCTQDRIDCMLSFTPKYVLALSANVERPDKLHTALNYIFGKNILRKISTKEFQVYKLYTEYKPVLKQTVTGNLDWNEVISSISDIEERNKMIAKLANLNADKKILILCKRKNQADILFKMLKEMNESVEIMYGDKSEYESCRILIGTISKLGIGFDDKMSCKTFDGIRFNVLILASDVLECEQCIGRIFRTDETPIVYDIVDDFSTFRKHSHERDRWFTSRNGKIQEKYL